MNTKTIHIISFDVPYPPSYGGTIDVYFKIKAFYNAGYAITLHCFTKNTSANVNSTHLKKITSRLYLYKYAPKWYHLFSKYPVSVVSRTHKELLVNLEKDNAPILFEGLKTTYLIAKNKLKNRETILRLHNIEHLYFLGISNSETNYINKLAYFFESKKYKKYEKIIGNFTSVATISKAETQYTQKFFNKGNWVRAFHGNTNVKELSEKGEYILYHGDLNTTDNRKAAVFLINFFKKNPSFKLVVAAGSKEKFIKKHSKNAKNITFIKLQNFSHLQELFAKAHSTVSWSFQQSGTKLKVINSLFNSRHCIVNNFVIDDTQILPLCEIATTEDELLDKINFLQHQPYNTTIINTRKKVLSKYLNDDKNVVQIINNDNANI